MKTQSNLRSGWRPWAVGATLFALTLAALAAPPVVKTVPWVASNPLIPHDTWDGKEIRLKGTCDPSGSPRRFWWDFGDGSTVASGTVTDPYIIEAKHVYAGPPGTVFTARLTVEDIGTGESASKPYYVKIETKTLPVEVNVAIDEGLWELHKVQYRWNAGGVVYGDWRSWLNRGSMIGACVNAFEVNGHVESGSADNPYTETVARGMHRLFEFLNATGTAPRAGMPTDGSSPPNAAGLYVGTDRPFYEGGMVIDAIVASGTPDAVAPTGGSWVAGRTYREIVQDLVDNYAYAQYADVYGGYGIIGGWRYWWFDWPDNSACQWAAIGILAAERRWGIWVSPLLKERNLNWLTYSQCWNGTFGYTGPCGFAWGPTATTASGLVQLAMDGKGRGDDRWDLAEHFMRDDFESMKSFYYGMFSFVKSMLLHDSNGDGVEEPIEYLAEGYNPLAWYSAEVAKGAPTDGIARTLVNQQSGDGWWWYHDPSGDVYPYETAWAIIILQRTLFEAGAPVAVASATPNPAVAGQIVHLSGADSYHQDPTKKIVAWDWDLNNDGIFESVGPNVTRSWPAMGTYPVVLRVGDDSVPPKTATTTLTIIISKPPLPPTANAGGPYVFCPKALPWFLDGRGSVNPDEGESEPGKPGDTIASYAWDLDGDGDFDDATGPTPEVGAFFLGAGPGSYLIQLRVIDTTATSFPSSGLGDLSDTDSTTVIVHVDSDPACACVDDLKARPKAGKIQLTWIHSGAHHYNVYRGTIAGGPYLKIAATTSTYSTFLDANAVNGTRYFYVVREADFLDRESCQSNETSAMAWQRP